ncbi:glycoside hydrolase family 3 N-terminal domain-containing protein [Martelella alba]|uniref:Beta-glucosidase n=1 Tax=Martelella alba TaxID=2590451 RepID=A0ABY2SQY2_9HYPH|nr:glycoside hydrolase family 3 N-terminal domain-containing protein [Martelella alba]TKI06354.1 beta-glucosidase [Martelella alba]
MTYPYQNADLETEVRVIDLLSRMTLEEKFAQMHALWLLLSADGRHRERTDASDEFSGVKAADSVEARLRHGIGQITRPLGSQAKVPLEGVRALNRLQRTLVEETRLGIPAMFHEECLVGLMCRDATLFPSALNDGATWDPALIERAAAAIGAEARSVGCHQGLAPVLDVSRDVRWGRTEETFGEDPYLVGIMACAYVRGLQGSDRRLLATLKHFAGHSFSEGGRNHAPVHLGFRELNDTFLLPFEMAVKLARAGSVMPAYHDIDNQPCHSDEFLLTDVLRRQWGFDGLIVADYGGISLLHQHHGISADAAASAALAFNAGLDIELPKDDCSRHLRQAVADGLVAMETVDAVVARVLREKFRLGLFEQPYVDETGVALQQPETRQLAYQVALESITVLENTGMLPLSPAVGRKLAVIGPTADDPLAMLSGYSFPVHLIISDIESHASQVITPLQALREVFGADKVSYAKGCSILATRRAGAPVFPGDSGKSMQESPVSRDPGLIPAAVALARRSDIALVFVGDLAGLFQSGTVGEGSDTDSLQLPGVQQRLLEEIVATGTPTIVVMTGGRPYTLNGLEDRLAGFMMAFEPGQEGGRAIADILSGRQAPSGRLTISAPKSAGAVPFYYNHKTKSGGTPIAFSFGARYPFGYGKSWTTFAYNDFCLDQPAVVAVNGDITARITLTNTGATAGVEVVQVYIRDLVASLVRPLHELKAFQRIALQPNQSAVLVFRIPVDMLNFTDRAGRRVVEPGEFEVQIGASSADLRASGRVTVTGQTHVLPRHWRMESHCQVV